MALDSIWTMRVLMFLLYGTITLVLVLVLKYGDKSD